MRTMQAVSLLCTSFPLDLRRIARSRAARVLVWLLALALCATNMAMAAMPSASPTASVPGAATAHRIAHDVHCARHAVPAATHAHCAGHASMSAHAGHNGDGCGCCIGKSCACVQTFDVPAELVSAAAAAPAERPFSMLAPRPHAAVRARLLRPPIA
jgi:hypothetical protein